MVICFLVLCGFMLLPPHRYVSVNKLEVTHPAEGSPLSEVT